ncbi:phosphate signaling complex protein PhoU [Carnobacteriaceae bacterium zg-ZUI240]|nr:phosphate signaling complex protein PhoU [Carnobacteriaceae bacterium zg-ZUI240]
MKRIFDEELHGLYTQFMNMGTAVNDAVAKSVKGFVLHDVSLAKEVIDADVAINEEEVKIEKDSFTLIALQQPVSSDLRKIVAMMKSTNDLERIADHAVSISNATINVKGNERLLTIESKLEEMASVVEDMLSRVLSAYVTVDVDAARQIVLEDEKVDNYLTQIHHEVVEGIVENPSAAKGGVEYVLVAGYLERIGDYITNICERIVYMETGQILTLN